MSNQHTTRFSLIALAVAGLGLAAAPAQAVDWGGYFRAGPQSTKKDASRACYGLNGPGLKYRLGNECDIYGEFALSQALKTENGAEYKAVLMTNFGRGGIDVDGSSLNDKMGMNQMYVEGKGMDFAPNTTFWAGKRWYGRADVHIVDTFFVDMTGVGAGATTIPVGTNGTKAGIAYFRADQDSTAAGAAVQPGHRINLEMYDIPVNPDGKLRVLGTATKGNFTGGKDGYGLTLQHDQKNITPLGNGTNTVWLQYAQGSTGLNANFGDMTKTSAKKGYRLVESFTWQKGVFGGQALALWQEDKDVGGVKVTSMSVGGRASYGITQNFKMVAEAGYSQKKPDGGSTAKLAKFTLAPTISAGPAFSSRPELRLYVTTAKWNGAAATDGGVPSTGAFAGKTTGTSYGVQVETWF